MVGLIEPSRLASTLCLSQRVNWTTVSVLVDSKGNKKTDTVFHCTVATSV